MADYAGTTQHDEPTYDYYADVYDGQLTEEAFNGQLTNAVAKVDAAIWPNEVTDATLDKYRRCICAVVDALDDPAVSRESAGRISVEYAEPRTVAKLIREHLMGTGLLYAGL
jgi:hypothetical protein